MNFSLQHELTVFVLYRKNYMSFLTILGFVYHQSIILLTEHLSILKAVSKITMRNKRALKIVLKNLYNMLFMLACDTVHKIQ